MLILNQSYICKDSIILVKKLIRQCICKLIKIGAIEFIFKHQMDLKFIGVFMIMNSTLQKDTLL